MGATSFFQGTPRPTQRDENTQSSQPNPAAVQSPKVPPNRQPGIRRKGSVKSIKSIDERQKKGHKRGGSSQNTPSQSIGGTKANIKPTAALKIEKHTQGTGDTGIRNGLIVKVGILVDEAPGTGEGCQNKFR